jgi:redox-sensitive bicupin YhaK (pirin superfamily)
MAARKTAKKTATRRKATRKPRAPQKAKRVKQPARHPGTEINIIPGAEVGPGGGKIILENDRVRIWDIALGPGQRSALHTHLLDYVLVQIEGDEVATHPHEDTQGEYNRRMSLETRPGDTCFIQKGGSETAVVTGKKPWREICIELK